MRTSMPSLQDYRKMYETAKSLGSAMLACNAVMIPKGYDELYLLIQNFPRPAVTHNDSADTDYALGFQSHTQGTPKTDFEGSITMIETVSGQFARFAEDLVNKHQGELETVMVYDGFVGDGSEIKGDRSYELLGVSFTFSDGGGEIDSSSRSQILQVQGNIRYHYFGNSGKLGSGSNDVFANALNNALANNGNLNNVFSNGGFNAWG